MQSVNGMEMDASSKRMHETGQKLDIDTMV